MIGKWLMRKRPDLDPESDYSRARINLLAFPETPVEPRPGIPDFAWWMFDETCIGMGAERMYDYTTEGSEFNERITRCYELAARAFSGWERFAAIPVAQREGGRAFGLAEPVGLIHGTWQGNEPERIPHAWVRLADGRVWEPITACICDPVLFDAYTKAEPTYIYDEHMVRINMLRSGHFGPWED